MERNIKQPFNYHTHTNRCGHAGEFTEEEYVLAARKIGLSSLGFSCHVPRNKYEYQDYKIRMNISEVGDYIRTIKELKEKYTDVDIKVGFEAEYSKINTELLCSLRDEVDYMVLGQHELRGVKIDGNFPTKYAQSVCEAMETGIFDIVVHPDIFLTFRDKIKVEEQELFDRNTSEAMRQICLKSKELNIPLEINIRGQRKKDKLLESQKKYYFPSVDFFKMCSHIGSPVLFGSDAHNPEEIETFIKDINNCYSDLSIEDLNFVLNSYDPVEARKESQYNKLYSNTKRNAHTYESMRAKEILENLLEKIDNQSRYVDVVLQKLKDIKNGLNIEYESKRSTLSTTYDINENTSFFLISRVKTILDGFKVTLESNKELINEITKTVESVKEYKIQDRSEFVELVCKIIEYKNTKNDNIKNIMNQEIIDLTKKYQDLLEGGKEKGNTKSLIAPNYIGKAEDDAYTGFTNVAIIGLIISFIAGFGIGIAYMLIHL